MARGDKGFARAKGRGQRGNAEQKAFLKKGQEAGATGKPRMSRKDIKRAKGMQPGEEA